MRDINIRFAPRELQAELSEGMVSKHNEMPQIEFSDEDLYAIDLSRGQEMRSDIWG
jgi:hypothetical protein